MEKKFKILVAAGLIVIFFLLFVIMPGGDEFGDTTFIYTEPEKELVLTPEERRRGWEEYEAAEEALKTPIYEDGKTEHPDGSHEGLGSHAPSSKKKTSKQYVIRKPNKQVSDVEFACLARNIYHEAGIESMRGKMAVGTVTMNRLEDGRWGNTICKVVFSKAQFSWTLSQEKRQEVPSGKLWLESVAAAKRILAGERTLAKNVTHYHAHYVAPKWADKMSLVNVIDTHIFYR